jgi:transcriptional regulator with XRE-family HTH domain
MEFGELLRGYRGTRGLTQEELAERSGLSVYAISMLERGARTAPRSSTVESLARALELVASERDALVAAARGRPAPAARVVTGRRAGRHTSPPRGPALGTWSISLLSVPGLRGRRVAVLLAGLLAVLTIGTVADGRLGAVTAPPEPAPILGPPPPSAVVYLDAGDRTQLRRVGYDGSTVAGSWSTTQGPVLSTAVAIQQVVGVSPDGEYAVTLDAHRQNWLIVDPRDQVVATVLATMESTDFGAWADDSRHVCRMGIADPLQWRVVIADVRDATSPRVVPVSSLPYPPYVTIAACDPARGRAVLVQPQTDTVPAPPRAARTALVVDLATGRIVTRVSIGDTTHGVVYSLDGRYLAAIDYERGTSSIVSLATGKTVGVEKGEIRGFSADDSRVVENSRFEPVGSELGTTRVVDWRSGRVRYSHAGWTTTVRAQPGGAALALNVMRAPPSGAQGGPTDLVIVPAAGTDTLLRDVIVY